PQVRFVDERRRLDGLPRPLAPHVGPRDAAQLVVHERRQVLGRQRFCGIGSHELVCRRSAHYPVKGRLCATYSPSSLFCRSAQPRRRRKRTPPSRRSRTNRSSPPTLSACCTTSSTSITNGRSRPPRPSGSRRRMSAQWTTRTSRFSRDGTRSVRRSTVST